MKTKTISSLLFLSLIKAAFGQLAAGSSGSATPTYSASILSGLPVSIPQATLTNLATNAAIIDCRFYQNQGLLFSFNNLANEAAPGAVRLTFARGLDGITFETTNKITWDIQSAGTNTARGFTNFFLGGAAFLQLQSISNSVASGTAMTNIVLQYGNKRGAP